MGKLDEFQIILDNADAVFHPGEIISGKLVVGVKEETKIRHVQVRFHGYANVHWTEQRGSGHGSHTVHFRSHENYFDAKTVVLGKARGRSEEILQPGSYSYPFSYKLPINIPSSYEAKIGKVRYSVQAEVDRPWSFNNRLKKLFTVNTLLDLNQSPELLKSASATGQKVMCCWCCKSDPIIATMSVDRRGYVPGEAIIFNSEIQNKSSRTMTKTKAKLMMQVKYHASSKTRTINNCVAKLKHGQLDGGGKDVWMSEKLMIPPVPPSYLQYCKIIDIRYFAMMVVDPSGLGFDLEVPVEVVIGSVPFKSVAQQYGMDQSIDPPPTDAPTGLYTETSTGQFLNPLLPSVPPPTYAESAFGRMDTKEADDDEHTEGISDFAPRYNYYNWSKQDPSTLFSVVKLKE